MLGRHAIEGVRFVPRAGRGSVTGASRRRSRRAWSVEVLEGRALLSVYLVDSPGDAGDGRGYAGDLRYAIDQANLATGDSTIVFAPSLSGQPITLITGMLTIDKPSGTLTILGPGAGALSISGGQVDQVLAVTSASHATVVGLTITGGAWSQGPGAGVDNNGHLTLARCTITGNTAYGGGGGGIANETSGSMSIVESTISGNVAMGSDGGGIENAGTMTIVGSTVSGNGSRGGNGGGIVNNGTLMIGDSTISGNRATIYHGGGIYNAASLTLSDDTISDNTGNIDGGGIANQANVGGTIRMDNTIVADNTSVIYTQFGDVLDNGDPGGSRFAGRSNLVGVGDLGSLAKTIHGDPRLGPLQANGGPTWTQAISPGSPAANAGDPNLVPDGMTADQRGFPYARIVQGGVDIGAFEIQKSRHLFRLPRVTDPSAPASTEVLIGLTIIPGDHPHGTKPSAIGTAVTTAGGE